MSPEVPLCLLLLKLEDVICLDHVLTDGGGGT